MAKIKLNLPTGVSVEKILLSCFKVDDNSYVIFDAESVGSMGLPIILVCKFDNNRVVKIDNAEEWAKVKGYLKEIISGGSKEYFKMESEVFADEIFYTQLTLPVASFDALKSAYKVDELEIVNTPPIDVSNNEMTSGVVNLEQNGEDVIGLVNVQPTNQVEETNSNVMPALDNILPESPIVTNESSLGSQVAPSSVLNDEAVANPLINDNTLPDLEFQSSIATPEVVEVKEALENGSLDDQVLPTDNETAEVGPQIEVAEETKFDYSADKEAFLKACENMFDALVAKFQNK